MCRCVKKIKKKYEKWRDITSEHPLNACGTGELYLKEHFLHRQLLWKLPLRSNATHIQRTLYTATQRTRSMLLFEHYFLHSNCTTL